MRDVSKIVKQCLREYDTVNESFLNNLLKFGTHADSVAAAIRVNIYQYKKEYPDHVSPKDITIMDLKKLIWNPKTKYFYWTGKEELFIGGNSLRPNKPIFYELINEWSSDSDVKEFLDKFNKSPLGKELMKASPEFKKQEEKRKKELQDKYDNDPEYQAEKFQKLIHDYLSSGWRDKSKALDWFKEISAMYQKWNHNTKFKSKYEKLRKSEDWKFDEIKKELGEWSDELRKK